MAKFCTKCGKELQEGVPCSCEAQSSPVGNTVSQTNGTVDMNWYVNSFIEIVKGIFTKPIDTIKNFAKEEYFILGMIALFINSLVTGLMGYLFLKESSQSFTSIMGLSGLSGFGMGSIEIPFMKVFLIVTLFMVVGFLVSALMIYVMSALLFKANTSMKKCIALVGTCSVLTLITTIVAIICIYISVKLFIIVLLLAGILYLCHLYHGIQVVSDIDENKQGYTFLVSVSVATFIVVYILPKLFF